jgi:hypothetical protein
MGIPLQASRRRSCNAQRESTARRLAAPTTEYPIAHATSFAPPFYPRERKDGSRELGGLARDILRLTGAGERRLSSEVVCASVFCCRIV